MIQHLTRLPAFQSHAEPGVNVEIIIALLITTAIGLWTACRGRKSEELVPEKSLFDITANGTQITKSRPNALSEAVFEHCQKFSEGLPSVSASWATTN